MYNSNITSVYKHMNYNVCEFVSKCYISSGENLFISVAPQGNYVNHLPLCYEITVHKSWLPQWRKTNYRN